MWNLIVSVPDHCLSFYFLYNDEGRPNGKKLRTCRNLKSDFEMEKYPLTDIDRKSISAFVQIRIIAIYLLKKVVFIKFH